MIDFMDIVSKEKRSEIMSSIKSKDSEIEIDFRKLLWKSGLRYRKNVSKYLGKPDIVLKRHKTIIFIDSCFWHGCKKHCRIPSTRKKYWIDKISNNQKRDLRINRKYKKNGWRVIRIWEHNLKKQSEKTLKKVIKFLRDNNTKKALVSKSNS